MTDSSTRLIFARRFLLKRVMDTAANNAVVTAKIPAKTFEALLLGMLMALVLLRVEMKLHPEESRLGKYPSSVPRTSPQSRTNWSTRQSPRPDPADPSSFDNPCPGAPGKRCTPSPR